MKKSASEIKQDYSEWVARETERLLNLKIPPRSYNTPFPAYGYKEDGTFGQIGMHGCQPGVYWTMAEWEAVIEEETP